MNAKRLRDVITFPAAYRAALTVNTDSGTRSLASVLDPWQVQDFEALDPAWRVVAGQSPPDGCKMRAYLERPRGHSKTTDVARMAIFGLISPSTPVEIVAASGDMDQARLIRNAIAADVRRHNWLDSVLDVQQNRVVCKRNNATLTILASEANTSYGLTPSAVIADELTNWPDGRGESFWISLFSAAAKKPNCLLIVISNAGTGQGSSWQWKVRQQASIDPDWYFSRLDGPQASWITEAVLAEQRRMLPAVAFDRLWMNRWSSSWGDAIPEADILASVRMAHPHADPQEGFLYVLGADLGLARDATGLSLIGVRPGTPPEYQLAQVKVFQPRPGQRVEVEAIEAAILDLHNRFNISCVAFDPWQSEYLQERLRKQGLTVVNVAFTQKNCQTMATATVEAFSERTISIWNHDRVLSDLRSLRIVERGGTWRLDAARRGGSHGDTAIALGLALFAATQTPLEIPGLEWYPLHIEPTHFNPNRPIKSVFDSVHSGPGQIHWDRAREF